MLIAMTKSDQTDTSERRRAALRKFMAARGLKAFSWADKSGVRESTIRGFLAGRARSLNQSTLDRLAKSVGVSVPELLGESERSERTTVPVVGYVGAGDFYPFDDHAQGDGMDFVEVDVSAADPIAVEVRGNSMAPVYRDRDRVICSRLRGADMAGCVGKDCMVALPDGRVLLKKVHKGSRARRFTLLSYSAQEDPIQDVVPEWCAPVLWVQRAG